MERLGKINRLINVQDNSAPVGNLIYNQIIRKVNNKSTDNTKYTDNKSLENK